jgi:hypothetical protein
MLIILLESSHVGRYPMAPATPLHVRMATHSNIVHTPSSHLAADTTTQVSGWSTVSAAYSTAS